jgi:hypothetical protein
VSSFYLAKPDLCEKKKPRRGHEKFVLFSLRVW